MNWQPIDTAPKDKTKILAFGTGTDKMSWEVGVPMPPMMSVIYWDWYEGERDEPVGDGLFKKVPERQLAFWRPHSPHFFKPTHWMPLPEPPPGTL